NQIFNVGVIVLYSFIEVIQYQLVHGLCINVFPRNHVAYIRLWLLTFKNNDRRVILINRQVNSALRVYFIFAIVKGVIKKLCNLIFCVLFAFLFVNVIKKIRKMFCKNI